MAGSVKGLGDRLAHQERLAIELGVLACAEDPLHCGIPAYWRGKTLPFLVRLGLWFPSRSFAQWKSRWTHPPKGETSHWRSPEPQARASECEAGAPACVVEPCPCP